MGMTKPLEGVKVVDLSTYVAAPTAAKLMADMGAEVVKVELIKGDPRRTADEKKNVRPHFEIHNSGKKDIALNLKTPEGIEAMHKLLSQADVFITNVRFAGLERLGLDHKTLREKYPRLIYGIVTAFGEKGPDSSLPGFDSSAFWSRSGFIRDQVSAESPYPCFPASSAGDNVTGMTLFASIMTALYKRERTGEGDYIETSLYGCGLWMSCIPICDAQFEDGKYPQSVKEYPFQWSFYKCKDGEFFQYTILDWLRDQATFFKCIGLEELIGDPRVTSFHACRQYNSEIRPLIEEAFMKKTSLEWDAEFRKYDLVGKHIFHYMDAIRDPQAWANDYLQNYKSKYGGEMVYAKSPICLESVGVVPYGPALELGEHSAEILKGVGYTDEDIAKLEADGIVKCWK